MEALLLEWGTEIILSLVIAFITYHFKKSDNKKDEQMARYQELLEHEQQEKAKELVKVELEPLWKELEEIRKRVFDLQDKHNLDTDTIRRAMDDREGAMRSEARKNIDMLNQHIDLIISSYKFRLVELCKGLEAQGFMYQYQYEHLNKFYHLYRDLGGNGQAQDYYERVCDELETIPNPIDYNII